jgi:hypothetical protein
MINNNFMSRVPAYSNSSNNAANAARNGSAAAATSANPTSSAKTVTINPSDQGKWATKAALTPGPTAILPSHSAFTGHNTAGGGGIRPMYSETGMRLDRTPTDEEINSLWKNMRTMLEVNETKQQQQQQQQLAAAANNNNNNASDYNSAPRPQVHLSQQYIDGTALGGMSSMGRVASGYPVTKPSPNAAAQQPGKPGGAQGKNGYMQRYRFVGLFSSFVCFVSTMSWLHCFTYCGLRGQTVSYLYTEVEERSEVYPGNWRCALW